MLNINIFFVYSQDKTLAMPFSSIDDKNELYSRLKAAAETGWDFSTKHYNNFGQNTGKIYYVLYKFVYNLHKIFLNKAIIQTKNMY